MSAGENHRKTDDADELEVSEGKSSATAIETKLVLAKKMINRLREELGNLERLLSSDAESGDLEDLVRMSQSDDGEEMVGPANGNRLVEGVFDGQNMIGSDGRQYIVPPNYASKSKLVEGDILKLTIQPNGTFLYKQIGPIERSRVVGTLVRDEITNDWRVVTQGKKYCVLPAAISYYKGEMGDDAVLLVPKATPSKWAALENIVKRTS